MKVLFVVLLIVLAGVALGRPQVKHRPAHHPSHPHRYTGTHDARAGFGRFSNVKFDGTHSPELISLDFESNVRSAQCVGQSSLRVVFTTSELPASWVIGAPVVGSREWGCVDAEGAPRNVFAIITAVTPSPDGSYSVSVRQATTQEVFTDLHLTAEHNMWGEQEQESPAARTPQGLFKSIGKAVKGAWQGVTHVIKEVERGAMNVVRDAVAIIKTVADAVKNGGVDINKDIYHHVFGVNYNSGTHRATRAISLMNNAHGSVTCTNCYTYLDVTAHVHLRATLSSFTTEITLSGTGNFHLDADLNARAALSQQFTAHMGSLNYNIPLMIGIVPFDINIKISLDGIVSFNIDASVATTLNSDLSGTVVVGAAFGSRPTSYASQWKGSGPWYTLATDSFKPTTSISSQISASGELKLALQPTLSVSIDGLGGPNFVLTPYIKPTIAVSAHQSGRTVSGTADLKIYSGVTASVNVAFHIPFIGNKNYGPWTMLNKQWLLYQKLYPFSRTLALPDQQFVSRRLLQSEETEEMPVDLNPAITEVYVPKQTTCEAGCTLATGLTVCASTNGAYVCVGEEEFAAREQAVAETVRSLLLMGPACTQTLLPFLCEVHFPRCGSDEQTLMPLCYDACDAAFANCGLSYDNSSMHCDALAASPLSPLAADEQACVSRDEAREEIAPSAHRRAGQCVAVADLQTCHSSTGHVLVDAAAIRTNRGMTALQLARDYDEAITDRAAELTGKARVNYIQHTCNQLLPVCTPLTPAVMATADVSADIQALTMQSDNGESYLVLPMCQSACMASFVQAGVAYAAGICSQSDVPTIGNYIAVDDSNCEGAMSLTRVFVPPAMVMITLPTYGFGLLLAFLGLCALLVGALVIRTVVLSRRLSTCKSVSGSEYGVPLVSPAPHMQQA